MAAGLTIARARGVEPALQSEPGAGTASTESDADVSVVICACSDERFEMLRQAIASVQRQATHAREVIVVIDHNPELLARARATFPSIQVLANSERSGLPGARNTGARVAQSDLVAFLDDDAVAAPDWIGSLFADSDGGLLRSILLSEGGNLPQSLYFSGLVAGLALSAGLLSAAWSRRKRVVTADPE